MLNRSNQNYRYGYLKKQAVIFHVHAQFTAHNYGYCERNLNFLKDKHISEFDGV